MIAIIDYKAGNLTSVKLALDSLGVPCEITNDLDRIRSAERVVFPGDGAAQSAMDNLRKLDLVELIPEIVNNGTPFLGICVGTQIIMGYSDEDGGVECLGLVAGTVRRFAPINPLDKVPQMGWNTMTITVNHPLFAGIENDSEFYFIHSYYPDPTDTRYRLGQTDYAGSKFASVIGKDNLFATQFHPERSGRIGLKLLENFTRWDGQC